MRPSSNVSTAAKFSYSEANQTFAESRGQFYNDLNFYKMAALQWAQAKEETDLSIILKTKMNGRQD